MSNTNDKNDPVRRFACTGTHGGEHSMCAHCANNIENFPDTPEGREHWEAATPIDEMVCRLPVGPDGKFWTQYVALHEHA